MSKATKAGIGEWFARVQFLMVSVYTFGGTDGLTINERPLMDELDDLVQSAGEVEDALWSLCAAADRYYTGYCLDEASEDGPHVTGCTVQQHEDAKRLRDALINIRGAA